MQDKGSFTRHLEQYCKGQLRLELISQRWKKPLWHESRKLRLRQGEFALVREIYIKCNNTPWVYARSIIPRKTLRGAQRRLVNLGARSLGSFLFSKQSVTRDEIEVVSIQKDDKLFALANKITTENSENLWGRRSIFYIKEKPLLVIEIFLPAGAKCINTSNK